MKIYSKDTRIWDNAVFVLMDIAEAKKGDNIIILADSDSYTNARAMCDVAREHEVNSFIVDVDHYGGEEKYINMPIMEPLRQAILQADITFMVIDQMKTTFGDFLGSIDDCDTALAGKVKRFVFEANGMEYWHLDKERVLRDRERTLKLYSWLKKAKYVRITTAKGTDITCAVGNVPDAMYPVTGIIPFYSEVAIVPSMGSVNGTVVADGASEFAYNQKGFPIRPAFPGHMELYKEPMKLVFEDSVLKNYSGDVKQVERLDKLMVDINPKPRLCDELGLVTTTCIENDMYGWRIDGTHQTHCIHVAIGNNWTRRKEIIHAEEHVDFDVHEPEISVDGIVIYKDREFMDDVIYYNAK